MSPSPASLPIDVISIFPEYLQPLGLSLVGRAVERGTIDLRVHDLRDFTHDRHRTVDDTPYGGGPGMVMKPEPWGEALELVIGQRKAQGHELTLVVPTPAGNRFTQATAHRWATEGRALVFACGRYEGIDQRVADWARDHMRVEEVTIGDYVLAGGEAAVLVMVEAVGRLLPGVLGNAESAVDDSFSHDGAHLLVEGPMYTKPAVWRGLEVPPVLLSGDHGAVARWRREQAEERTRERRPDLGPDPSGF